MTEPTIDTCATCRHWRGETIFFQSREHRLCTGDLPQLLSEPRAFAVKFRDSFGPCRGAWLFTASDEGCAHHLPIDVPRAVTVELGTPQVEDKPQGEFRK